MIERSSVAPAFQVHQFTDRGGSKPATPTQTTTTKPQTTTSLKQFNGPMDTSAAAVAALAFLQLAEAQGNTTCGRRYLGAGINTLRALGTSQYLASPSENGGAALLHATGNRPQDFVLDMGIVFGDYYLLEAVEICRRLPGCIGAR